MLLTFPWDCLCSLQSLPPIHNSNFLPIAQVQSLSVSIDLPLLPSSPRPSCVQISVAFLFSLLKSRPLLKLTLAASSYPHPWQHQLHTLSLAWQACHRSCWQPSAPCFAWLVSAASEHSQGHSPAPLSQNHFSAQCCSHIHAAQQEAPLQPRGQPTNKPRVYSWCSPICFASMQWGQKTNNHSHWAALELFLCYQSLCHQNICKATPSLCSSPTISHKSS